MDDLAAQLVRSPVGAAWLAELELSRRDEARWIRVGVDAFESDPAAVLAATEAVRQMSFGDAIGHLLAGADRFWGPWTSDAERSIVAAYAEVEARSGIADALVARFGERLEAPIRRDLQEWWLCADAPTPGPVFERRGVYCCGEFTWSSVRTASAPPDDVHDQLVDVWEMYEGQLSRWRVAVRADARVIEVHRPADWAKLVARYPSRPGPVHGGRELPGPNFDPSNAAKVEVASDGAATRRDADVAMPDWERMAADVDGVHLSWAGMATCEGRVIDVGELGPDVVSVVRYWGSERTLWLNDVFDTLTPLPAPALSGRINGDLGIDADDPRRRPRDVAAINTELGRKAVDG